MKYIKVLICTTIIFSSLSSFAAENKSTLLLTQEKGGFVVDFLNENDVTALQFDISIGNGQFDKSKSLSSCVAGLAKTHTGSCAMQKNGKLRVLIYSDDNAVLESGTLGTFNLKTLSKNIKFENVLMGTADAKKVESDVVVDLGNNFDKPFLSRQK